MGVFMSESTACLVAEMARRNNVVSSNNLATTLSREFNRIEAVAIDDTLDAISDLYLLGHLSPTEAMDLSARHTAELQAEGKMPSSDRSWDPFGDQTTNGILRNHLRVHDGSVLGSMEYVSIRANMPRAIIDLRGDETIDLGSWLRTHHTLLADVFPWAGTIRHVDVYRGPVKFNFHHLLAREIEPVFQKANDPGFLRENIGYIYGELAFNHPFLDGNGRSLNTVFTELLRRSGLQLDWGSVDRTEYLKHLTQAVLLTNYSALDSYFKARLQSL